MLVNDAFQIVWGTIFIPDPVGINHRDGPINAYPQTFHFASLDSASFGEAEFLETRFEKIP